MSCGSPHLDIFKDTTKPSISVDGSLELDRIKDKIRSIWNSIIVAQYNEQYKHQKDADDDYVAMSDYLEDNRLYFPGEDKPESEVDNLLGLLDDMLDTKEDLDPISKEGKAPAYGSKTLSSNNEKGKVEKTIYNVQHATTVTPKDSKTTVMSSTYDKPKDGKEPKSNIHERGVSMTSKDIQPMLELLDIERRRLLRLVTRRNKEYGVRV
jgi:hypothetical protein